MELLTGKEAATRVQGILHTKYQVHGYSVNLTVKELFAVDPTGKIDFGGSEFVPAGRIPIVGRRRHPEDRYPWWEISHGSYFVEFNETLDLAENEIALIEPDDRLRRAGATHGTVFVRGHIAPLEALLQVNTLHLELKQNARISRLRLFRLGRPAAAPVGKPKKRPAKKRAKTKRR